MGKIRIELKDEEITMRVSPDFVHKYVKSIDGDAYIDYGEGEEPILLSESYENILVAATKIEQSERDARNR